jgi:hypothetical protein
MSLIRSAPAGPRLWRFVVSAFLALVVVVVSGSPCPSQRGRQPNRLHPVKAQFVAHQVQLQQQQWVMQLQAQATIRNAFLQQQTAVQQRKAGPAAVAPVGKPTSTPLVRNQPLIRATVRTQASNSPVVASTQRTLGQQIGKTEQDLLRQRARSFRLDQLGQPTVLAGWRPTVSTFVQTTWWLSNRQGSETISSTFSSVSYSWINLAVRYQVVSSPAHLRNIKAGDILQFRNTAAGTHRSAGTSTRTSFVNFVPRQGSAIVQTNLGNGQVAILRQNPNDQQSLIREIVNLSSVSPGTVYVYPPPYMVDVPPWFNATNPWWWYYPYPLYYAGYYPRWIL